MAKKWALIRYSAVTTRPVNDAKPYREINCAIHHGMVLIGMEATEILFNILMSLLCSMVFGIVITQILSFIFYNLFYQAYDEDTAQKDIMYLSGIDFLSSLLSANRSSVFILFILSIKWDSRHPNKFVAKHRLLDETPKLEQFAWWLFGCYLANIVLFLIFIGTMITLYLMEFVIGY